MPAPARRGRPHAPGGSGSGGAAVVTVRDGPDPGEVVVRPGCAWTRRTASPAGSRSFTRTLVAGSGPALDRVMVKVISSPTLGVALLTVLVAGRRSASCGVFGAGLGRCPILRVEYWSGRAKGGMKAMLSAGRGLSTWCLDRQGDRAWRPSTVPTVQGRCGGVVIGPLAWGWRRRGFSPAGSSLLDRHGRWPRSGSRLVRPLLR